jgi:hypothetical protein
MEAVVLTACQQGHGVPYTAEAALYSKLIQARDEKKVLLPEATGSWLLVHLIVDTS